MSENDPAREIADIETTMRENPDAYWRDGALQARLGELYRGRDGNTVREVAPAPAPAQPEWLVNIGETLIAIGTAIGG